MSVTAMWLETIKFVFFTYGTYRKYFVKGWFQYKYFKDIFCYEYYGDQPQK